MFENSHVSVYVYVSGKEIVWGKDNCDIVIALRGAVELKLFKVVLIKNLNENETDQQFISHTSTECDSLKT